MLFKVAQQQEYQPMQSSFGPGDCITPIVLQKVNYPRFRGLTANRDLVAAMLVSRDFKEILRKGLPIYGLGVAHAFQVSFERQTPHSSPASSSHELARV
jgi:hypothetical protein